MFGYTPEEWSNALKKYEQTKKEQTKMTREEAIRISNDKWPHGPNVVACLEALGLLKFDDEVTPETVIKSCFQSIGATNPSTRAKETINNLKACGYEIIETSKVVHIDYKDGTRRLY